MPACKHCFFKSRFMIQKPLLDFTNPCGFFFNGFFRCEIPIEGTLPGSSQIPSKYLFKTYFINSVDMGVWI